MAQTLVTDSVIQKLTAEGWHLKPEVRDWQL